ncbi:class I SAM-dependent methyltransferase [Rhabdochromatium marinum]|uniref:class I SAM-dependent methyltransferase n=1 Tax=Rhabdochromatium marinum TaxID=48729 RepID=UPI0030845FAF
MPDSAPQAAPQAAPDQQQDLLQQRLLRQIQQQIRAADGALSFDQFMELALYAPGLGYYVAGLPKLGPAGDFVTAPEISPLFGQCLAEQCREVLAVLGGGDLLEFGAGSGALAAAILSFLERHQALPGQYFIVEPSPDLQARQRERLQAQVPESWQRVRWLSAWPSDFSGVVLANEVLDAMPVQRFCIDPQGAPLEVFVSEDGTGESLVEQTGPVRSTGLREAVLALQAQGLVLTPGYCSEINLRLPPWVQALAAAMERGLVLIIDYGYPRSEYYHPQRHTGTLIGHYRHQAEANIFAHLGQQDISAHVDFSALADAALAAGFSLAGYTTQANFLIGCGFDQLMMEALADSQNTQQSLSISAGARQLLLPNAMGERFQVMGLSRGLDDHPWRGFGVRDLRARLGVPGASDA